MIPSSYFFKNAFDSGLASTFARASSNAPMLSKSPDKHPTPSVPVITIEKRRSTPAASFQTAAQSLANAIASACLPGAIGWVLRYWIMGLSPVPVCASRTPPARPCVWSSVPCWSTGGSLYPHLQVCARKRNHPAIARMNRAASQWMRGSGVPPDLFVFRTRNPRGIPITKLLVVLLEHGLELRAFRHFGVGSLHRAHALVVC